jgi:hypothetical protein
MSTTWTAAGLPDGVTASFDPNPSTGVTSDETYPTFTASDSAVAGTITLSYVSNSTTVYYADGQSAQYYSTYPIIIEVVGPTYTNTNPNLPPLINGSTNADKIQQQAIKPAFPG